MTSRGTGVLVEDSPSPVASLVSPSPDESATGPFLSRIDWSEYKATLHFWYRLKPQIIGGRKDHDEPYLKRWFILPRNPFFNVYLHKFEGSDDDEALHDHPWWWASVMLRGGYWEVRPYPHLVKWRAPGTWTFRGPNAPHRVELARVPDPARKKVWNPFTKQLTVHMMDKPAWTLFFTGPKLRTWGFHCPQGWIPWQRFTDPEHGGCGENL